MQSGRYAGEDLEESTEGGTVMCEVRTYFKEVLEPMVGLLWYYVQVVDNDLPRSPAPPYRLSAYDQTLSLPLMT